MKPWVVEYLVCLECRGPLSLHPAGAEGDHVVTGSLECAACGAAYVISGGVPRMLRDRRTLSHLQRRTADAFGWQWLRFDRLHEGWEAYESRFLDWIAPFDRAYLRGKTVLDAGCGMGEFSAAAARLGAGRVIGADLSDSVDAAFSFTREMDNVGIVQADIYDLPFARPFDLAFSIGVIHHLPDPPAGIAALARHAAPGGTAFAWVYGYENNGWVRTLVDPLRKGVTSRLPRLILFWVALALALPLHLALKLLYGPAAGTPLERVLPYFPYLKWLSQYELRHTHCVTFDHLNAPAAVYVKHAELERWLERAGLAGVTLSARNNNSWRGWGTVPVPAPASADEPRARADVEGGVAKSVITR